MGKKRKALLEKAVEGLNEKAADAADIARTQRVTADRQHQSAHKLEKLSLSLRKEAEELEEEVKQEEGLEKKPDSDASHAR